MNLSEISTENFSILSLFYSKCTMQQTLSFKSSPLFSLFRQKKTTNFHVGGRVVQTCWVNIQCRSVLLIWITVGQGPIALAVGAGGGCLDIFSLVYYFSFLSPSLWETARYRLKYCLKGPLSPKQPTNKFSYIAINGISP